MNIIKQLRNHALPDPYDEREVMHAPLLRAAADEIEKLRKERDDLIGRPIPLTEWQKMEQQLIRYRSVMKQAAEALEIWADVADDYAIVQGKSVPINRHSVPIIEAITALRTLLEEGK